MKKIVSKLIMMAMLMAAGSLLQASSAVANEKPAGKAPAQDQAAMMQEMMKLGSPSENHKHLDTLVGKWEYTATWWMEPQSKPEVMKGSSENSWVLGGRFIQQQATSPAQGEHPAFTGMGLTGYDNMKNEYNSIWVDNMATGMMKATGQFDKKSNTMIEKGTFSCPMTGEKSKAFETKWKITDNDHYTYEMWVKDTKTGKQFKSMEIAYQRTK
jgi:hypothetical protein